MFKLLKKKIKQVLNFILRNINSFYYNSIDLGSGDKFSIFFCKGIDQLNGKFLNKDSKLDIKKESLRFVYSSHFIEHIDDETFLNLFYQCYQFLKKGSVLRIVTPNFELIKKVLDENDTNYINNYAGWSERPEWKSNGIKMNIENWALSWFAIYQNQPFLNSPEFGFSNESFYRGPPKIDARLIRSKSKILNAENFSKWAIEQVPKKFLNNGGHINFWNFEKIKKYLEPIGFECIESSYAKSINVDCNKIDRIRNRRYISSYFEMVKK